MSDRKTDQFDPITLEVYWNRLISIADEAATGLLRTAFSTIVRESNDYATVLMDRNGDSVAENTATMKPTHASLATRVSTKFGSSCPTTLTGT